MVRTRFAPSPTGFMHVGNLRTALYEYLVAKSQNGTFVLRIEDTDQERYVEGATDVIYNTLQQVGLQHDEGPDIGGEYGPYVQSERKDIYKPYAEQLVREGKAYYCFCTKERLESIHQDGEFGGYDRHCRDLPAEEIRKNLDAGMPYVIRQRVPLEGSTSFEDAVYGTITIENKEIEDQVLLKSDGYPTYNFANVIDDHLMHITHVVRGCEYLTSTPKYNMLYDAFGWEKPIYVHLPLIMGKNEDGSVSKLSKRHGSTSFQGLLEDGYLAPVITNYIALLGWCPKDNREIFSLKELEEAFSIDGISKSPAVFDYDKLLWFNGEYIRKMSGEEFRTAAMPYYKEIFGDAEKPYDVLDAILQPRILKFKEIPSLLGFFKELLCSVREFKFKGVVSHFAHDKVSVVFSRLSAVYGQRILAFFCKLRIISEKVPVSGEHRMFHFSHRLVHACLYTVIDARSVSYDQRRSVITLGFSYGFEGMSRIRPHSYLSYVYISVGHSYLSQILFLHRFSGGSKLGDGA